MDLSVLAKTLDRTQVRATLLGHPFTFVTGNGLFSADRVDDGTTLLLKHLPVSTPRAVLDVGCGYGALGLPVAALHKSAQLTLVDRDLVAVAYAARNAEAHQLTNVTAMPSLGYRELGRERYDWVLCNVPARIGEEGVRYLLGEGAARLEEGGELRVVVIRALAESVIEGARAESLDVREVAAGKNHIIYSVAKSTRAASDEHECIYVRDSVKVGELSLERPHDISEDPAHLRDGIPLLMDMLPKHFDGRRALVVRGGYGAAALTLLARGGTVVAADHDLMNLAFTARNARGASKLSTIASAWPLRAVGEEQPFDLIVLEVASRAGDKALHYEVSEAKKLLADRGEILWLGLKKPTEEAFSTIKKGPRLLGTRASFALFRDTR